MKYRCPCCGFAIFNRRLKRCESCQAELPAELLYTPEQVEALDAQAEADRQKAAAFRRRLGINGGSAEGGGWTGDECGIGGGDCGGGDGGGD